MFIASVHIFDVYQLGTFNSLSIVPTMVTTSVAACEASLPCNDIEDVMEVLFRSGGLISFYDSVCSFSL